METNVVQILHATNNGRENSGECLSSIGLSVPYKHTGVPENKCPRHARYSVGTSQSEAFGHSGLVPELERVLYRV